MNDQPILKQLYRDFNARNIDAVLAFMHADVDWPNGWEGGYVSGHDEVRAYWLRQWQQIDPVVEPVSFEERPDGRIAVGVHQLIRSLDGQIVSDGHVNHVYTFDNGKVRTMAIEQ
ncbi:nuclear transport factor 2 family protein [Tellurirhabdus rosea]|uniref:nuclear transport factor 2 family protein n=1 Tax=Tellurirhabdus rosea TaxID=2674997 RepID=UPI0022537451|nr:nuclear transport factor 2 family protein [Tellurirhabdus rosea]